jgi:hypothetical protein
MAQFLQTIVLRKIEFCETLRYYQQFRLITHLAFRAYITSSSPINPYMRFPQNPPLQILLPRITYYSTASQLRTFSMATSLSERRVRRFAPLREGAGMPIVAPRLKGVIFDVDGTLW